MMQTHKGRPPEAPLTVYAGAAMPLMLLAFGDAFDQLGLSATLSGARNTGSSVTKMLLTFIYIGAHVQ